jgi:hypothetical protein
MEEVLPINFNLRNRKRRPLLDFSGGTHRPSPRKHCVLPEHYLGSKSNQKFTWAERCTQMGYSYFPKVFFAILHRSVSAVLLSTYCRHRRPHIQSPTLRSRCGINKGLIKRGRTIDHWRSRCKGWILWPTPYTYIHTYIHITVTDLLLQTNHVTDPTDQSQKLVFHAFL